MPEHLASYATGRRLGREVFVLGLGLAVLVGVAYAAPALLLPLLLTGAGLIGLLLLAPLLVRVRGEGMLMIAVGGYVLITVYEAGIQATEALYGLFYSTFLLVWFVSRRRAGMAGLIRRHEDIWVLLFLGWGALITLLGVLLFNAKALEAITQISGLALLAFYFPIRDLCRAHPRGALRVLQLLLFFGLYVALRNVMAYRDRLAAAEAIWQIAMGRISLAELLLVGGIMAGMATGLYQPAGRSRNLFFIASLLCLLALVLTQSRGYWVTCAIGLALLFLFLNGKRRLRMASWLAGAGAAGLVVIVGVLGPQVLLIAASIAGRMLSIGTAVSQDASLISRFYEAQAVLERVAVNPILGHGMASPFTHFDILDDVTATSTFIHNGFVDALFKFGVIGLGLILAFWITFAVRAYTLHRQARAWPDRALGAAGFALLVGWVFVANTSSPFSMADGYIFFGLVGGGVSGAAARIRETHRSISPIHAT